MPDFWTETGFKLAQRDTRGRLTASDEFLRALWNRGEVAPVAESCDAERTLHAGLLAAPRRAVSSSDLAALRDPDARDNYGVVLDWRDRLLAADSMQSAYLNIFRGGDVTVPPALIDQLAQLICRSILDAVDDPLEVRAAELFFRPQKVSLQNGRVMLADAETVRLHESGSAYGDIGRLLAEAKIKSRKVDLDVVDRGNAERYWSRSDAHDTVIEFRHGQAALDAFCRVIEKWIRHFYDVDTKVRSLQSIESTSWAWHIGLDAEATRILNDLYHGQQLDDACKARILCLFQLDFSDSSVVRSDVAGHPVYLGCAMNRDNVLRIKPQNLLLNLPLTFIS